VIRAFASILVLLLLIGVAESPCRIPAISARIHSKAYASERQGLVSTRAGIISETNQVRIDRGLPPLLENELLNRIAEERLKDMLREQYFGHISPSGDRVDTVAKRIGYRYRRLGENLESIYPRATSRQFVANWMKSPGHRKNILNPNYGEIGVAVEKASLQGKVSWISVQIFGKGLP